MKKSVLQLLLSLCLIQGVRAQGYITIPDTNFVQWLQVNVPAAMSGNQMDTTSSALSMVINMDVSYDSITDLSGVQYFTQLQQLNCSHNQLDSLPNLASTLVSLNCSFNYLAALPALPGGLTSLLCNSNHLHTLPVLPSGLTEFDCSYNQLSSLPVIPPGITELNIYSNHLSSLDSIPAGVTFLDCSSNLLTTLPVLPDSLTHLQCGTNQLTSLPPLPATLTDLSCYSNLLPVLPSLPLGLVHLSCYSNVLTTLPSLPASLVSLDCGINPLGSLPSLPAGLQILSCNADGLSNLPVLSPALTFLDCSSNALDSLPALPFGLTYLNCSIDSLSTLPALPASLMDLHCSMNLLTALPVLPSGLVFLVCDNNQLSVLPSLPATLAQLNCSTNLLPALPALPGSLTFLSCGNNTITNLPAFPAGLMELFCGNNNIDCFNKFPMSLDTLFISPNPFTCLPNYLPGMYTGLLSYPLCIDGDTINNPHACPPADGIVGFSYEDMNSNCAMDSSDLHLRNIKIKLLDSSGTLLAQTFTAMNGVYQLGDSSGTYTVQVDTTGASFVMNCPYPGIDSTLSMSSSFPLATNVNFSIGCQPGYDLGVQSISHDQTIFPNEITTIKVNAGDMSHWYHMNCAAGISGTVSVHVTGPATYLGPAPGALTPVVTGSVYTYSIADYGSIVNDEAFRLLFIVDSLAHSDEYLCVQASVNLFSTDNDTSNNLVSNCFAVSNSHDPNLKEVYPESVSPNYTGWLTYTIHFQNTGSGPAHNIRLVDTLNSRTDWSSFELLDYDHYTLVTLTGNVLTARFPNIMLADSSSDPEGSKAYIQFRVRAKPGLIIGDEIPNTAAIYFDFNDPMNTNTAVTKVVRATSIERPVVAQEWKVYPNPSSGQFHFDGIALGSSVEVVDLMGRSCLQLVVEEKNTTVDLSNFGGGVYLYRIKTKDGGMAVGKLIVR